MKIVAVIWLGFVTLLSCETNEMKDEHAENPIDLKGVEATVTSAYAEEGCEFILNIIEDGEPTLLMPLNLDDKYKVHGTKLRIEFHSSKIKQDFCQIGRPILIDHISFVD